MAKYIAGSVKISLKPLSNLDDLSDASLFNVDKSYLHVFFGLYNNPHSTQIVVEPRKYLLTN